jgi:Transposase DDE domain
MTIVIHFHQSGDRTFTD